MTPFPIATDDLAELKRFRAVLDAKGTQPGEDVKALKTKADQLLIRLSGPVRVAVLGLPGSGKTSLVNFLVGTRLIPPDGGTKPRPPVIVRFDTGPKTVAGWWSGIEIAEAGLNLEGAALQEPDFIEFRLPNPILKFISFLDMPRVDDAARQAEQLRWVASRADLVLWCTRASEPWSVAEAQLWGPLKDKLLGRSLLILTHAEGGAKKLVDRLRANVSEYFQTVVPIATIEAIKAAPDGKVVSAAGWESSGGKTLAASVLSLARAIRKSEIDAARKLIASAPVAAKAATELPDKAVPPVEEQGTAKAFAPEAPPLAPEEIDVEAALPDLPGPVQATEAKAPDRQVAPEPEPAPDSAPLGEAAPEDGNDAGSALPRRIVSAKHKLSDLVGDQGADDEGAAGVGSEAEPKAAAEAKQDLLLDQFRQGLDAVIGEASEASPFDAEHFLASVSALTKQVAAAAMADDAIRPDAAWLRAQLSEAVEALDRLAQEPGPQQCLDGATILLQLARDLSWATIGEAG